MDDDCDMGGMGRRGFGSKVITRTPYNVMSINNNSMSNLAE